MSGVTMNSAEVAATLGYLRRDGRPNTEVVRKLVRSQAIPAPIDLTLPTVWWRWSTRKIETYVAGDWQAAPDEFAALETEEAAS